MTARFQPRPTIMQQAPEQEANSALQPAKDTSRPLPNLGLGGSQACHAHIHRADCLNHVRRCTWISGSSAVAVALASVLPAAKGLLLAAASRRPSDAAAAAAFRLQRRTQGHCQWRSVLSTDFHWVSSRQYVGLRNRGICLCCLKQEACQGVRVFLGVMVPACSWHSASLHNAAQRGLIW